MNQGKKISIAKIVSICLAFALVAITCLGPLPHNALRAMASGTTIEIGTDSSSAWGYFPSYSLYNYCRAQTIYTASELGNFGGPITGFSVYCTVSNNSRNLKIYVKDVDKLSFASGTDWISYSNDDLYFEGTVTYTANAWNDFTFSKSFNHDASKNLLICVEDSTGSWGSSNQFKSYSSSDSSCQTIYKYQDGGMPSMSDSGYISSSKTSVKIYFGVAKADQVISASDISITIGDTGNVGATLTTGDGTLSYALTSGDAISLDTATGDITAISEGTATVTITASETATYNAATKVIQVTVSSASTPPAPATQPDWLDSLRDQLHYAGNVGGDQTIEFAGDAALPYEFMQYLQDHPQVTLIYHVQYGELDATLTIPGSMVVADPEIPWYGPLWLNAHFGERATEKAEGVYIVKRGDTLFQLAIRFHTTVRELVAKNGIKDPNKIYPGQELRY